MESEFPKLLVDYVLAAVFIVLYVRSQAELAKAHKDIAEQRREENREMRQILFELAREAAPRSKYPVPTWEERPPTEPRPANFPAHTGP